MPYLLELNVNAESRMVVWSLTGASINIGVGRKWVKIQSIPWNSFWKHNISAFIFNDNSKPCFICCLWTHWIDSTRYWQAATRQGKWIPSQPYSLYLWLSLKSPFSRWTLSLIVLPTSFILSLFCSVSILFSMKLDWDQIFICISTVSLSFAALSWLLSKRKL